MHPEPQPDPTHPRSDDEDSQATRVPGPESPRGGRADSSAGGASARAPEAIDRQTIGPFVLERELGRGGQGVVWLARDARLPRRVALKILTDRGPDQEATLRRFRKEAVIASSLAHPGICGILEAGVDHGISYIAMPYVRGETLAVLIKRARETNAGTVKIEGEDGSGSGDPTPTPSSLAGGPTRQRLVRLLRLFEIAARALHVAHEAGVVHRDIKPANLMVDRLGQPVLLDFGLARQESGTAEGITMTGEVIGTPAYLAPELLRQPPAQADARSDVYALGVSLFESLTLSRPFEGDTRSKLEDQILHGAIPDVRRKEPLAGRDLQVVIETALERDPGRRYASALELAEDLRRVIELQPIRARPVGWAVHLRRWTERNARSMKALGVAAALVIIAAVIAAVQFREADRAIDGQRAVLEKQTELQAQLRSHELGLQAERLLDSDPRAAVRLALEATAIRPSERLRLFMARALPLLSEQRRHDLGADTPFGLSALPDGERHLLHARHSGLTLRTIDDARVLATLVPASETIREWTLGPRGERVAVFDGRGRLLTMTPEGRDRRVAPRPLWPGRSDIYTARIVWSHDGRYLFIEGAPQMVTHDEALCAIVSTETLEVVHRIGGHEALIRVAAFQPNGEILATSCSAGIIRWTRISPTGFEQLGSRSFAENARIAWSPDGKHLARGASDGQVSLVSMDGSDLELLNLDRPIESLDWSPDGRRLLVVSANEAHMVNVVRPSASRPLQAGSEGLRRGRWIEDGDHMLVVHRNHTLAVHAALHGARTKLLRGHSDIVIDEIVTDGGRSLMTTSADGTMRTWSLETPWALRRGQHDSRGIGPNGSIAFARGGRAFKLDVDDGSVTSIPTSARVKGRPAATPHHEGLAMATEGGLEVHPPAGAEPIILEDVQTSSPRWSPGGTRIATSNRDGRVDVIEGLEGSHLVSLATETPMQSGRGHRLAWLDGNESLITITQESGQGGFAESLTRAWSLDRPDAPTWSFRKKGAAYPPVVSNDRQMVAIFTRHGSLDLLDTRDGKLLHALVPDTDDAGNCFISAAAFTTDDSRLLVGQDTGIVTVFDLLSGKRIARHAIHDGRVISMLTIDEHLAASVSRDRLSIWEIQTGLLRTEYPVGTMPRGLALSPDGAWIHIQESGQFRRWPVAIEDYLRDLVAPPMIPLAPARALGAGGRPR